MTDPFCFVSSSIPHDQRRRVYIASYGYGWEQDRITLRGTLHGIGVMLDTGVYKTFSPSQIGNPPPAERTAEVIQFPRRFTSTISNG